MIETRALDNRNYAMIQSENRDTKTSGTQDEKSEKIEFRDNLGGNIVENVTGDVVFNGDRILIDQVRGVLHNHGFTDLEKIKFITQLVSQPKIHNGEIK